MELTVEEQKKWKIIIDKYVRKVSNSTMFNKFDLEDYRSELWETYITRKIKYNSFDGAIIHHVNKKAKQFRRKIVTKYLTEKNETYLNESTTENTTYLEELFYGDVEHLLKVLTSYEKFIINQIYWNEISERELSKLLEVSRQAINKAHRKALKKMRETYKWPL